MSVLSALLGAAGAVLVVSALAVSSLRVARRMTGLRCGVLTLATAGYVATLQVAVVMELLGAAGILYAPVVLLTHLVVAGVVLRVVPATPGSGTAGPPWWTERGWLLVAAIAVPLAALTVVQSLSTPASDYDTLRYHLVNAGWWLQHHGILTIPPAAPGDAASAVAPGLGELFGVWLMLPTHGTELAFLLPALFGALTVLGITALAVEAGVPAWRGALAGVLVMSAPAAYLMQADTLLTDTVVLAGVVGLVLFLHVSRRLPQERRWAVLAGLLAGVALGAKFVGIIPVILVAVLFTALSRRRLRLLAEIATGTILVGAVWYVRNWAVAGGPLYPRGLTLLGRTVWSGGYDNLTAPQHTDSLAAALVSGHPGRGVTMLSFLLEVWGPMLLIGFALLPLLALVARRAQRPALILLSGVVALLWAGYLLTPFSGAVSPYDLGSATRFSLWAGALGTLLAVSLTTRLPLAVGIVGTLAYNVDNAVRPPFHPALILGVRAAAAAIALSVAVGIALALMALMRRRGTPASRPLIALTVITAWLALAAVLLSVQRGPTAISRALDETGGHGPVLIVHDADVADVMGPHFEVDVEYAGDGPRGIGTPFATADELDRAVAAMHPSLVVVGSDGIEPLPPGWSPPASWTYLGPFNRDSSIYAPPG